MMSKMFLRRSKNRVRAKNGMSIYPQKNPFFGTYMFAFAFFMDKTWFLTTQENIQASQTFTDEYLVRCCEKRPTDAFI